MFNIIIIPGKPLYHLYRNFSSEDNCQIYRNSKVFEVDVESNAIVRRRVRLFEPFIILCIVIVCRFKMRYIPFIADNTYCIVRYERYILIGLDCSNCRLIVPIWCCITTTLIISARIRGRVNAHLLQSTSPISV